ncbi:MAG: helix-turn-helix domain-containing protein [Eubacteriales bacterium]|nr:helix-turn-helix domain-containing protein [Eubacteriales bacterium]
MEDTTLVLDVKGLQSALGIGRDLAYGLMHSRSFPSIRIGNRYVVEKEALRNWLKRNEGREISLS